MQDAEEPRSKLRSPLEVVQAFEERPEDLLHHVFRFGLRKSERSCGPEQRSRMSVYSFSNRMGITPAKAFQKFWADWNRGYHREPL